MKNLTKQKTNRRLWRIDRNGRGVQKVSSSFDEKSCLLGLKKWWSAKKSQ